MKKRCIVCIQHRLKIKIGYDDGTVKVINERAKVRLKK
jgi:hypothetical protein